MGLIKTKSAEQGREEERYIQEIIDQLNYYKGRAEALEMVIKLLTNKSETKQTTKTT